MDAEVEIPRSEDTMDPDQFMELHDFFEKKKWIRRRYKAFFDLWNRCDTQEQRQLVKALLERFTLIDTEKLDIATYEMADIIINEWGVSSKNSRIAAIKDDDSADGSQFLLQALKNKFADVENFDEHHFLDNLKSAKDQVKSGYSLVLVDDFAGTGNTVAKKINWLRQESKPIRDGKVSIYLCFIGAMNFSRGYLESFGYPVFSKYWLKKGISEIDPSEIWGESIDNMKKLEGKLANRYRGLFLPTLGYKQSESLFCVDGCNVPNNVFPVFWWPRLKGNKKRPLIFQRIR